MKETKFDYNASWGVLPSGDELERCVAEDLRLGRIIRENRGMYRIADGENIFTGEVSGAFRYRAVMRSDYPAVGDWVACRGGEGSGDDQTVMIEWVFSRRSCFSRKVAGDTAEEQVIAANVDRIFLVFALNGGRNFTASGLERYLTVARDSGAVPVVVLNKADLVTENEAEAAAAAAGASAPGVEIRLVSAVAGTGIKALTEGLQAGTTVALTGPSGTGKSTLINALSGTEVQRTGAQRESDGRGRHTTTFRQLFRLESGLLLIDNPGMRELQMWGSVESTDDAFSDIAEIAGGCRFSDCSHQGEPGCAVQAALASGELEYRRYENYLELRKELEYLNRRQDAAAAEAERRKWKSVSKQIKKYYKQRY